MVVLLFADRILMIPTPNLSFPCAMKSWTLLEDAAGRKTQNPSLSLYGQPTVSSMPLRSCKSYHISLTCTSYLLADTRL